jgi:nucleotide-binding universal stress UspA family protein
MPRKSINGKAKKEKREMKILVAFDGSEPAKKALRLAREHAHAFQAEMIYVINCLEGDAQTQIQHLDEAEQHMAYARVFLSEADIYSETKLSTDAIGAGEEIVAFAEEKNIDEIIIGIVQKSKVGKLLFGSTAQYVILNAICPVVTVK